RVEVGVGKVHRLAVAVDLAALAPHHLPGPHTPVPHRALAVGAGDQEVVARAPETAPPVVQQELHAGVDAPAGLGFLAVACEGARKAARVWEAEAVGGVEEVPTQ